MASDDSAAPLDSAAQAIRDAAKYLIAAFGAIGAVLVGGLSFTALPSGAHPVIAAVAVAVAVLALAGLVGLGVSVLTPEAITLGGLAELEDRGSSIVDRLKADEALFLGQAVNLNAFHESYLKALKDRAEKQEAYLDEPKDEARKLDSEVAASRAEFLNEAVSQVLETAVFYQLEDRFSIRRRVVMTLLALVVVAGAGVFAWASSETSSASDEHLTQVEEPYSAERVWLQHLIATSGYRIEMLDREAERAPSRDAGARVHRALVLQRRVQRRERAALRSLGAEPDGAG